MSEYNEPLSSEITGKKHSRNLNFHGTGSGYFPIFIVNVLLTFLTLGVFGAWALVRSKKYFYANTELAGERFSYSAKGSSLFLSWLLLFVIYAVFAMSVGLQKAPLALCILALIILFLPYLVIQGTRYQLMMTSINQVRFNFHCKGVKAWWALIGLPLVMILALIVVVGIVLGITQSGTSLNSIIFGIGLVALLTVMGVGVTQGVLAAQWLNLLGNGLAFGQLKFSATVHWKKCVTLCLLAVVILVPFLILAGVIIVPVYIQTITAAVYGGMDEEMMTQTVMALRGTFILAFLIYSLGILVANCFLFCAFRRYVAQAITLDKRITFRSTMTFLGCLWQMISNILLTVITCGLAYPWAKVRFSRYLAENTWVDGDLDALELQDHDEQPATDIVGRLSRGIIVI